MENGKLILGLILLVILAYPIFGLVRAFLSLFDRGVWGKNAIPNANIWKRLMIFKTSHGISRGRFFCARVTGFLRHCEGGHLGGCKEDHTMIALPGAVLSCFAKKVPKEATRGGAEKLLPQLQAPSPRPLTHALTQEYKMFRCGET